ncbi:MAG: hypothetical protein IT306_18785 [Chloroflexi bacterium]|nr:hypothetical protein [Chloroflexota bacterium]
MPWQLPRPAAWARMAVLLAALLLAACDARPIERPREGAPPGGGAVVRLETGPPPTLVGAAVLSQTLTPTVDPATLPSPSASPGVLGSPVPSPGAYPIISGLQPAPGVALPPGDVVVGARVSASSDLSEITVWIDNEPVAVDLNGPRVRSRTVSIVRGFALGQHEIRIQARDDRGLVGGYRWQFTVGTSRAVTPTALPGPETVAPPIATLFPIPTRRPTITPFTAATRTPLTFPTPPPKPAAKPTGVPATPTR